MAEARHCENCIEDPRVCPGIAEQAPALGHRIDATRFDICPLCDRQCWKERPADYALTLLQRYRKAHYSMALTAADADAAREYRAATQDVDEYLGSFES